MSLEITVPTYYPDRPVDGPDEYDDPAAVLRIVECLGIAIEMERAGKAPKQPCPHVIIERRKHGWMLFIFTDDSDAVGMVQIHDDGRSCLIRDKYIDTRMTCPEPGEDGIDID